MSSLRKELIQPSSDHADLDADGWECREHMNKSDAEMLLDWLESNGFSQRKVSLTEDGWFTVHWRR